jgi:hypothetical protein
LGLLASKITRTTSTSWSSWVEFLDLEAFFLSDRIGEFDPIDLGLLLDPSGLEVSDFFEDEKNSLFLNTISF